MRINNLSKQNKIIVGVVALILALTVGYAIFSQSLNINGTAKASGNFELIFNSVGEIEQHGSDGASATRTDNNKTLSITVPNLQYPTAYVVVPATIKNTGTIDAVLKGITTEGLNDDDIEVTYTGVKQDEIIKANEEKDISVKILWKESSVKKSVNLTFNINLNYEQVTGQSGGQTDTFKFPKVTGSLGDNVTYSYDDGDIVISGTGDMNSDTTSLSKEIATGAVNELAVSDEKVSGLLEEGLDPFLAGETYESAVGSREEMREMMLTPESEDGLGLTEDQADYVLKVLDSVPTPKSITIEEGVTSIRADLISFKNITTITVPSTVNKIGARAIRGSDLKTIVNNTGKEFDWNNIISGSTGNSFIEGEVSNTEQTIDVVAKTVCTAFTKKDTYSVGDVISLCNEKTGKSEDFYVTKDNGTTVSALAKYNLFVKSYIDLNEGFLGTIYSDSDTNYGLQSPKTLYNSENIASGKIFGCMRFADGDSNHLSSEGEMLGYWTDKNGNLLSKYGTSYPADVYKEDENKSLLHEPLTNYLSYIKDTLGKTTASVTIPSYNDLIKLGCSSDNNSCETDEVINNNKKWIYDGYTYWTKTANSSGSILSVISDGSISQDSFSPTAAGETRGLRPLITINKSDL